MTPGSIVTVKMKATTITSTTDPVAIWYEAGSPRILNKLLIDQFVKSATNFMPNPVAIVNAIKQPKTKTENQSFSFAKCTAFLG